MGYLTVTQLVAEVQAALLLRTDLTPDRCVMALNFAQTRISRAHDFLELKSFYQVNTSFTSSAFNDKFLPLPAGVKHIHSAVLQDGTNSRKMVEKPWRWFDKNFPMPEALARSFPSIYSRWNEQIILYPVPQQVYPVFMRITTYPRQLNLETGPTETSDFNEKDDILIALAAAYLWKSYGRSDKANDYLVEAETHFREAIKQDTDVPDMDINIDLDIRDTGNYWLDPFQRTTP